MTDKPSSIPTQKAPLLIGASIIAVLALAGIWISSVARFTTVRTAKALPKEKLQSALLKLLRAQVVWPLLKREAGANWQNVQVKTLPAASDTIWSVAISPDAQTFASASQDKTIKIWTLPDRKQIRTSGHHNTFYRPLVLTAKLLPAAVVTIPSSSGRCPLGSCFKLLQGIQNLLPSLVLIRKPWWVVVGTMWSRFGSYPVENYSYT